MTDREWEVLATDLYGRGPVAAAAAAGENGNLGGGHSNVSSVPPGKAPRSSRLEGRQDAPLKPWQKRKPRAGAQRKQHDPFAMDEGVAIAVPRARTREDEPTVLAIQTPFEKLTTKEKVQDEIRPVAPEPVRTIQTRSMTQALVERAATMPEIPQESAPDRPPTPPPESLPDLPPTPPPAPRTPVGKTRSIRRLGRRLSRTPSRIKKIFQLCGPNMEV